MGDQSWGDVLANHQARTRDVVEHHHGRVVDFAGDGVLAMFDGAARAIRCAVGLVSDAAELGLAIHGAVHTGEIEVAETSIRGVSIHEASRIMGLAGAGEILVSDITASLARDAGLAFEDRGERELRGLAGARRLFAVVR
jgi:class 3 adenylate cyclase